MITTLLAASVIGVRAPSIETFFQRGFVDASLVIRLVSAKQSELAKINKDFGEMYKFDKIDVKLKEPFMLRLVGSVNDTDVLFVQNGVTRLVSIPRLRIKTRENLSEDPGKRQSPLDFGFLTPAMFDGLFAANYVRHDRSTGHEVFDLKFKNSTYRGWFRIWVDPASKTVSRREKYKGKDQIATFVYSDVQTQDGVSFPTRLKVYNVENKLAGETRYDAVKINKGLEASLFKV